MSVVPEPRNGVVHRLARLAVWFRIGISERRTGFWAGWSNFSSVEPPMIIFGLGARQIVLWSRSPWNRLATPGLRTTQQGSWPQWYQPRLIANRPLSQITWPAISKPIREQARGNGSRAWTPACQT